MKYRDLISQMTLEEKCHLLSGDTQFSVGGIPRLNIPGMFLSDGPHGIRKQAGAADHLGLNPSLPATCYPTAATMANSWDPELGEELGAMLGEEARVQRVNVLLGPGLNMKRSPLCGRNFEYFAEDPVLAGKLAAAYIRGIQSRGVSACPKHFAVNSQERLRMHNDSVIDERTLREIYLTGFEIAVQEGKPQCIMSSYNRVNGEFASENPHLLQEILRDEWGFEGFSVTDWGGSDDRVEGLKAGTNLEMPTTGGDSDREVAQAVREGRLSEELLDQRLDEYLTVLFDTAIPEDAPAEFDVAAHHAFARKAAGECIVLLKNEDGILPLAPDKTVALIGDFADTPRYQGAGSSAVNSTQVDSLKDFMGPDVPNVIGYAPGFDRRGKSAPDKLADALALAGKADVVVLCLGLDEGAESEGLDREHMALRPCQNELVEEVSRVNPNIVVVLSGGAPVELPWLDKCKGLLHGYLSGQAGAGAMADVLLGKLTPSGKLAETWPMKLEDTPCANYYPGYEATSEYREGPFIGYRYYETAGVPVTFPFGFGLSYTTFRYSDLKATEKEVTFTLANTGDRAGAEVAQVYIGKGDSGIFRPVRELKAFAKVKLAPGESKAVTIPLDHKAFRCWNVKTDRWEVEPGTYQIAVGASCADLRLTAQVEVQGTDAPLPCDKDALPSYFSGHVQDVPDAEFAALLGRPIPPHTWDRAKPLDRNDTFAQLCCAKGWVGRLTYRVVKGQMDKALKSGADTPDLNALFIYNMPLRGLSKMTGGMISMAMADGIIEIFNGHFFKGAGHLISGFFRKGREAKATAAALGQR